MSGKSKLDPGAYLACDQNGVPVMVVDIWPDGHVGTALIPPAECTVCRQGGGNDCAHFTARP